jgi:hypothetical protein
MVQECSPGLKGMLRCHLKELEASKDREQLETILTAELLNILDYCTRKIDGVKLAQAFVEIHNEAAVEYKKAFAKIDARMWTYDDCHPYKKKDLNYKEFNMEQELYDFYIKRPLTVLDSWPEARAKRDQLDKEVDEIYRWYTKKWEETRDKLVAEAV